nr:TldD/PmbA family protein [bacterium]
MLHPADAQAALARALSYGGDFAEIFYEDTDVGQIALVDGRIQSATSGREHGAGIRVMKGTLSAYAYTSDTRLEGLLETASRAAIALGKAGTQGEVALIERVGKNIHPILYVPGNMAIGRKVEALKSAYAAAKGYHGEIAQASASWQETDQRVTIANTQGLYTSDRRVRTRFMVSAVASSGTQNQTGSESTGAMVGGELLEHLDVEKMGQSAARMAHTMLHAEECPAGRVPVAIENGFGGVIIHEACVHSLEATSVSRGASEFCGKLGQAIAAPCVTVIDDGTIPNAWGSSNIDDEGNPTQRNVLIENGILKSYLIDIMGSRRMGMAINGCGRRQDYRYAPTSRMSNTFIAPGQDEDEAILSSMPDGLYAKRMGGGSVSPTTGEFNFFVREGYWIKNGAIDRPVRGATLVGRGSEVLMKIDRVGKHLAFGQGMCGSQSGSIPTDVGQPLIRVSELTVGGRKG